MTHNGKEIKVAFDNKNGLYKVFFGSGGELPEELAGLFTSDKEANIAILKYLDRTKPRKTTKEE